MWYTLIERMRQHSEAVAPDEQRMPTRARRSKTMGSGNWYFVQPGGAGVPRQNIEWLGG
jgi:hypothetical protein